MTNMFGLKSVEGIPHKSPRDGCATMPWWPKLWIANATTLMSINQFLDLGQVDLVLEELGNIQGNWYGPSSKRMRHLWDRISQLRSTSSPMTTSLPRTITLRMSSSWQRSKPHRMPRLHRMSWQADLYNNEVATNSQESEV